MALSGNARGALLMMGAVGSFTTGDAFTKAIGDAMPLSQFLVMRGVVASAFIALLAWRLGAFRQAPSRKDRALIWLRALAEVGSCYFFLTALRQMPLANVTALMQLLPLTMTLGSAILYREMVGWRRWSAVGIGFLGMLLIVRPGSDGFNEASLLGLLAVACVTIRDLAIRRLSTEVHSLRVTLAAAVAVVGFATVLSLGQEWQPMTPRLTALLAGATVCVIFGYTFSVMVMRVGDVSFTAPFRYTGLVVALILGFVVFGDWPVALTLVGAALIVGSGAFTLLREAQLGRRSRRAAALQAKRPRT